MKFQRLRETIPLLITFGAVLVIGVLFFSFSKAEAALEITLVDETLVDESIPADTSTTAKLPQPPDVIVSAPESEVSNPDDTDTTTFDDDTVDDDTVDDDTVDDDTVDDDTVDDDTVDDDTVDDDIVNQKKSAVVQDTKYQYPEYEETFFQSGDILELSGNFHNDVIVIGQSITIDGEVDGDVIVVASDVTINAPVHGNVRLAAGQVYINNTVDRNVTALAGEVVISELATIQRDVYAQADFVGIYGTVNGSLRGGMNTVHVDGTISGDLNLKTVQSLSIGQNAIINGDVLYSAYDEKAVTILGTIHGETISSPVLVQPKEEQSRLTAWFVVRKTISWLAALLVGLVLILLMPKRSNGIVHQMISTPGRSLIWGFTYVVGTAFIVTVFMFTIIGIPLSIMGVLLFGISMYIANIMVGTAIGRLLLRHTKSLIGPMLLGITIYYGVMGVLDFLHAPWSWLVTIINVLVILWAAGGGVLNLRSRVHDRAEIKHVATKHAETKSVTTKHPTAAVQKSAARKKTTAPFRQTNTRSTRSTSSQTTSKASKK